LASNNRHLSGTDWPAFAGFTVVLRTGGPKPANWKPVDGKPGSTITPFTAPSLSKASPSTRCSVTTLPLMVAPGNGTHAPPMSLKYDVGLLPVGRMIVTSADVAPVGSSTLKPSTPTGRSASVAGAGEYGGPTLVTSVIVYVEPGATIDN